MAARQEEVRNKLQQAIDKNGELTDELMDGVTAMMISESRTVTPRLQVQNQISEYVYARTVSNLQTDLTHILRNNEKVSENMREYASGVVSSKEWSCNITSNALFIGSFERKYSQLHWHRNCRGRVLQVSLLS